MTSDTITNALQEHYGARLRHDVPLENYTTISLGGPAKLFLDVATAADLQCAVQLCLKHHVPYAIVAAGSNLICSDAGFAGLIIHVTGGAQQWKGDYCTADAGVILNDLVTVATERGLAGLENLAGVPGTVGGAVRGNAGAYGAEIKNVVVAVTVLDAEGNPETWPASACDFTYRHSRMKREQRVILSCELRLHQGDRPALLTRAAEVRTQRQKKYQAIGVRTAGSIFKNFFFKDLPPRYQENSTVQQLVKGGKLPAWYFIKEADCGSLRIGDLFLSPEHANTMVNAGQGTAAHALMLISAIKQHVRDRCGVQLEAEVQFLGF